MKEQRSVPEFYTFEQLVDWVEDQDDRYSLVEILDELVHDAKSEEAARINNSGTERQLRYLLSADYEPPSREAIADICETLVDGLSKGVD